MLDDNFTNKLFDDLVLEKTTLLQELKTVYSKLSDDSAKKERFINSKLVCIDNLIKNILKYRNIILKDKQQSDL
jgi:hypothetical protein